MSRAARARAWTRHLLLERAHDATDLVAGRSLLVLAPHPDDETLGCAGRIQRAVASGAAVTIVVATDGGRSHDLGPMERDELRALRRSELVAACACLGVPEADVITLDFADGELADSVDELAAELETLLRRLSPDDVCVTCAPEAHPDHATCARALGVAADRAAWQGRILSYPIWLWSDWPVSRRHASGRALASALGTAARRRVEVVRLDGATLDTKRAALGCYGSQLGGSSVGRAVTTLPTEVLDRALDGSELFFRTIPRSRRGRR